MPISSIYDFHAASKLQHLVNEDAGLVMSLYSGGRYIHRETPLEKSQKTRRQRIENEYRSLFLTQFETAGALDRYLKAQTPVTVSPLPYDLKRDMSFVYGSMLPVDASAHGPVTSSLRQFPLGYGDEAESLVTIERGSRHANVYLSHIPGGTKGSPTNFVREIAEQIRGELKRNYSASQINFFIHIPRECANVREHMMRVDFSKKLERGQLPQTTEMPHIPLAVAQAFADHSPEPKSGEEARMASHYRDFQIATASP